MKYLPILLFLIACHKSSGPTGPGVFSANLDGHPWIAQQSSVVLADTMIFISGTDSMGRIFSITLHNWSSGDYNLGPRTKDLAWCTDFVGFAILLPFVSNVGNDPTQAGGKVSVTEIDRKRHTITANFSLNLYNDSARIVKKVTQGLISNLEFVY